MKKIKVLISEGGHGGFVEEWPLEKLVYLILKYGGGDNRIAFEEIVKQEYITFPFSSYCYSWPKEELLYEKFVEHTKNFPTSSERPFDESLYDYFSIPFQPDKGPGPIVCYVKDKPELAHSILQIFREHFKYDRFDYYCERDLYYCIIEDNTFAKLKDLPRKLRKEFESLQHKRIHPLIRRADC